MKTLSTLALLLVACGSALAQNAPPADKPAAAKEADKPAHDMKAMHGMMMGRMRAPVCLYEGRAYSKGALLVVRGVKPLLQCVAAEAPPPPPPAPGAAGDAGHAGHGGAPPALEWRVYAPGRAVPPAHEHKH